MEIEEIEVINHRDYSDQLDEQILVKSEYELRKKDRKSDLPFVISSQLIEKDDECTLEFKVWPHSDFPKDNSIDYKIKMRDVLIERFEKFIGEKLNPMLNHIVQASNFEKHKKELEKQQEEN